jgi:hypothetical protein
VGLFVPIVKEKESQDTFLLDGLIVNLGLTGVSYSMLWFVLLAAGVLIVLDKIEPLWYLGIAVLLMLLNDLRLTVKFINTYKEYDLGLMWGWIVLFSGALVLIYTARLNNQYLNQPPQQDDELSDETTAS